MSRIIYLFLISFVSVNVSFATVFPGDTPKPQTWCCALEGDQNQSCQMAELGQPYGAYFDNPQACLNARLQLFQQQCPDCVLLDTWFSGKGDRTWLFNYRYERPTGGEPVVQIYTTKPGTEPGCNADGGVFDNDTGLCMVDNGQDEGEDDSDCEENGDSVGNPIRVGNTNKLEMARDFTLQGEFSLHLTRYYSFRYAQRDLTFRFNNTTYHETLFPWHHNYESYLISHDSVRVELLRPNGQRLAYLGPVSSSNGVETFDPESTTDYAQLTRRTTSSPQGPVITWHYILVNGNEEVYDINGLLVSVTSPTGLTHTINRDANDLIQTVVDDYGQSIQFFYDGNNKLDYVIAPDSETYDYGVDSSNRFNRVTFPDLENSNPSIEYQYNDPNFDYALTGFVDENQLTYASWTYDVEGRAISSEHAGTERVDITFNPSGSKTITNLRGKTAEYTFENINGSNKLSSVNGNAIGSCVASDSSFSYTPEGELEVVTENGIATRYVKGARGLVEEKHEALVWDQGVLETTVDSRTELTQWHVSLPLPEFITKEWQTIDYEYTDEGRLELVTVEDTTSIIDPYVTTGRTRTTTLDYVYQIGGTEKIQSISINGPRDDLVAKGLPEDITLYEFDSLGNLEKMTAANGDVTEYRDYNILGLPGEVVDPNAVTTELVYDERGRLRFSTVKHPSGATNLDSITEIRYYPNGLVERVILPDTTFLRYEYNDARHLIAVENSVGERVEFDPSELNGEWETATTKDASLITKRIQNRVQDELGRLRQLLGNNNQSTTYTYDADDNLVLEDKDGELFDTQTVRDYDFLHRLTKITEPLAIVTELGYDTQGNVDTVIDPNLKTTTYLYDGFGDLIRQVSPDTGMTRYWYDKAGNLIQQVDANDIQIDFDYDELNRMISKAYPNSTQENVSYRYDDYSGSTQYPNAKGRLTEVSYEEGSVIYVYDHRGNVIERIQTIQATNYTTQYVYNLADEIIGITYPSGREVIYTEDPTSGKIISVTTKETASSPEETIASNITYHPFGPVSGFTHGNQLVTSIPLDLDYRVDRIDVFLGSTEILRRNYGYDWFNNVNAITDEVDSTYSKTFEYDVLQRLSDAYGTYLAGTSNHIHYGYDSNSNRNQRVFRFNESMITSETYTYSSVSNRLNTVAKNGGIDRSFDYDSVGNLKSDAAKLLQYNHANRLIGVEENSQLLSEYKYNYLDQRSIKKVGNNTVHSHYDLGGQLISETHSSGQFQKEYIYLYGQKIALILPDGTNPTVTISAPSDGGNALEGSPVSFSASASDNEDGDVSDSIEWSSEIDGVFGNGSSVSTNSLSPGTHQISAVATDSHGSTGSASISFTVDAAPTSIDFGLTVETKTYFFFIKYDILRWTNDVGRTDIYRNNVLKESNLLSTTWSFPTQSGAVYKVCLTGTQVCSPDTSP